MLKGKLEGTGFEWSFAVPFAEPGSFSQNRINIQMALELLCERQVAGLEIKLWSVGAFFGVTWMCKEEELSDLNLE